ncbi:uncharacterized protein LOC134216142 [Armigeres subalbatus]|uniref:uncharacterized protein LOC134216142 n=1 Tax=Armigeres subalbatus TaxID=124917 RepID=UPI002ED20937
MLVKAPAAKHVRQKWIAVLQCDHKIISDVRICRNHFHKQDKISVVSTYLKYSAIPTRAVGSLKRRRKCNSKIYADPSIQTKTENAITPEHGYAIQLKLPRSRTMCFAVGCTEKAGNGIVLHKFPLDNRNLNGRWMQAIRRTTKPTKFSRICSRHFLPFDYKIGGKRLKPDAVPSQHLPRSFSTKKFRLSIDSCKSLDDQSNSSLTVSEDSDAEQNSVICGNTTCSEPYYTAVDNETQIDTDNVKHGTNTAQIEILQNDLQSETNVSTSTEQLNTESDKDTSVPLLIKQVKNKLSRIGNGATLTTLIKSDKDANTWTGLTSLNQLDAICVSVKTIEDQVYQRQWRAHTVDRVILTLICLSQHCLPCLVASLFQV